VLTDKQNMVPTKVSFILCPYFVQNKYVPHTNNLPPLQRTNNAPIRGGWAPQFGNLWSIVTPFVLITSVWCKIRNAFGTFVCYMLSALCNVANVK
jgi:hypothetical protein